MDLVKLFIDEALFINFLQKILSDPKEMKMFVLDEADEMLSRGFKDSVYEIFRLISK